MIHFLHHNDTFFACHFRGLSCILFPPSGKLPSHHMEAAWDQVSYEFFPVFFCSFFFLTWPPNSTSKVFPKLTTIHLVGQFTWGPGPTPGKGQAGGAVGYKSGSSGWSAGGWTCRSGRTG